VLGELRRRGKAPPTEEKEKSELMKRRWRSHCRYSEAYLKLWTSASFVMP
jgi:hypothetical protein